MSLGADIAFSFRRRCPVCHEGRLFKPWTVSPVDACAVCQTRFADNDVGDGAAVFLIFLLGFLVVPMAWMFENVFSPPMWLHLLVWGLFGLALIALILPASKAYIMLLEYRHLKKN